MLTHDAAFLADIGDNPDDDAPRMIYADWLDDHGEPARAEFIRVQVERARLAGRDSREAGLTRREGELRLVHEAAWRASLPQLPGVTWEDFTRGFVEAVFVETVEDFLLHAGAIFAAAPVRRVQVGTIDADAARRLARSSELARLTELNVGNNPQLGLGGVRALAGSPHVANLSSLLLHYNELGDEAVSELACSPYLGKLAELYLSGNDLGDAGVTALARADTLPRLAELDLRDNRVGDVGAVALTLSGWREALTTLYLVNNRIGPRGGCALAESRHLPRLSRLYLNYNPVGNDAAVAFAGSAHRRALTDLDLRHCDIRDAGGQALARSPHFPRLELLWLGGNRMRMETLTLLRDRFGQRLKI